MNSPQTFVFQPSQQYAIQVWGADGGYHSYPALVGKGGYSFGTYQHRLPTATTAYIYVGAKGGGQSSAGGWNGGGLSNSYGGSGGGASDIRVGTDSLYYRIIVAGGGGGTGYSTTNGGHGGGYVGVAGNQGTATTGGQGGTQTSGGVSGTGGTSGAPGAFGSAGSNPGDGGGGWYGGGSGQGAGTDSGGGGGSGYVHTWYNIVSSLSNAFALIAGATLSLGQPGFVANPDSTGNGYVRITRVIPTPTATMGACITVLRCGRNRISYITVFGFSWLIVGATKDS